MAAEPARITLGHSPDPDDVFMWWPLTGMIDPRDPSRIARPPVLDTRPFEFVASPHDIEALNRRAVERGDLDVTAISMHTYPYVCDRYALTSCGASMGEGYGPKIVCRAADDPKAALELLRAGRARIAVPGVKTTAYLVLCLMLGLPRVEHIEMRFDGVLGAVASREAELGLVIHEGQLTFAQAGLVEVADLGAWWRDQTGLPLPLGANAIRRDLDRRFGAGAMGHVAALLRESIQLAIQRRPESLKYAARFAPGTSPQQVDRFVTMYVNDLTIDAGERGARAIRRLLEAGHRFGLCPDPGEIELIGVR